MCTNVWATTYTEIGYVCMAASGILYFKLISVLCGCEQAALALHQ